MMYATNVKKWSSRLKHGIAAVLFLATYIVGAVAPFMGEVSAAIVSSSVSSTGFVLAGGYSIAGGQPTGSGQFKNGNVGSYPEGACIPAVFQVKNTSGVTGDLFVTPVYDYAQVGASQKGFTNLEVATTALADATAATNLNQMSYPGTPVSAATGFKTTSGASVSASVSGPYAGNDATTTVVASGDSFRHYNVTLQNVPADVTVNVLLCGRLGLDASEYNGSSLSLRTVQGGQENVPIPVNQILALPSIAINKTVTQGTALPSDFSFTVSPSVNGQSVFAIPVGSSSVTIPNVNPDGVYTVTESGSAGYLFTGGNGTSCSVVQSSLNTAAGEMVATVSAGKPATNASCSFVNTIQKGSITIKKDAVPNSPQDFTFTTTGSGLSNFSLDDDSNATLPNSKTFTDLLPGTYTVSEMATAGWDMSGVSCSGGGTQVAGAAVSITLVPGANVSCTYTNRQHGRIVVRKVTNPAYDKTGFPVTISGSAAFIGSATRTVSTDQSVTYEVSQGTFNVAESVPSGWTQASNTCTNLVINGNTPLVNGVPTLTCTITNTKMAKLKIVKQASPEDAQDFTFTTTGTGLNDFSLDDDNNPALPNYREFTVAPGSYSVTEAATPDWILSDLKCNNRDFSVTGSKVMLQLSAGDDVVCTYENTKLASLTGTKYEVNIDGSTVQAEPSGWLITLLKDGKNTGVTQITDSNGKYTFSGLLPGNYSVAETLKSGWTQIYSPLDPNCQNGSSASGLDFGNFRNGSISGYKFNDHNANGVEDNSDEHLAGWTIKLYEDADGDKTQVGNAVMTNADGTYSFTNLRPATYWVCEVQQNGWTQTYPANNACHKIVIDKSGEVNPGTAFGNTGQGTLTVKKNVDSNGDGTVDYYNVENWSWDAGGDSYATGTTKQLTTGGYTVSEHQKEGYHFTAVVCTGQEKYVQGESVNVYVAPGQEVVCTFTNTRDTGWVKVVKNLYPQNDSGRFDLLVDGTVYKHDAGNDDGTGWLRVVSGDHVVAEAAGTNTNSANYDSSYSCWEETDWESDVALDHDWYWDMGEGTSAGVPIVSGQSIVCSFYNERHSNLNIHKTAQPNGPQDFTFDLWKVNIRESEKVAAVDSPLALEPIDLLSSNSDESSSQSFMLDDDSDPTLSNQKSFELSGGWYGVQETPLDGWDLTNIECGEGSEWYIDQETGVLYVWLEPGENTDCTFTNSQRATVTIVKDAQPNFGQPFAFTTDLGGEESTVFSLTDDGVNPTLASTVFGDIVAGSYSVTESVASGWSLTGASCSGAEFSKDGTTLAMEVEPGAHVVCTFVNQKNTVPQVLGEVTVTPPKLEATGGSVWVAVAMSITVVGLACLTLLVRRREIATALK